MLLLYLTYLNRVYCIVTIYHVLDISRVVFFKLARHEQTGNPNLNIILYIPSAGKLYIAQRGGNYQPLPTIKEVLDFFEEIFHFKNTCSVEFR